jgi:hypothetical protein
VDLSSAAWGKSARSGSNGCVEVAFVGGQVAVRDSKNRDGSVLLFTSLEWKAFIDAVRDGQFELPDSTVHALTGQGILEPVSTAPVMWAPPSEQSVKPELAPAASQLESGSEDSARAVQSFPLTYGRAGDEGRAWPTMR